MAGMLRGSMKGSVLVVAQWVGQGRGGLYDYSINS